MIQEKTYTTDDAVATEKLGEAIGALLRGGEVIELSSDLGGGKTTLVRGLARGAQSPDHVASPTFTVSREYGARDGLRLYHFDFYRLAEAGIIAQELEEIVHDPKAVTLVEWSDIVQDVLPERRLRIALQRTGENSRTITLSAPETLTYLMPHDPTKSEQ